MLQGRVAVLVAIAALAGCVESGGPQAVTPEATTTAPVLPERVVQGTLTAGAGTPPVAGVPFLAVTNGDVAFDHEVGLRGDLRLTLEWSAIAPTLLELHAQAPGGTVQTARPTTGASKVQLDLRDASEGTWIIGISPEGPAASVDWTITIAAVPK